MKVFTIFTACFVFINLNAQISRLDLPITVGFIGMAFNSSTEGIVLTDQDLTLRTTDGGMTWDTVNLGFPINFSGAVYSSNTDFFVYGGPSAPDYLSGYGDFVLKSEDSGESVDSIFSTTSNGFFRDAAFTNNNYGICTGSNTYRTVNGGSTFEQVDDGLFINGGGKAIAYPSLQSATISNLRTYDIENNLFRVLRSEDQGLSWTIQIEDTISGTGSLHGIDFVDDFWGHIVTVGGHYFRTNDGGQNWTHEESIDDTIDFVDVEFYDFNRGFAIGNIRFKANSYLFSTVDAGDTWTRISVDSNALVRYLEVHDNVVYMGSYDEIYKYEFDTSAIVIDNIESETIERQISLYPNPASESVRFHHEYTDCVVLKIHNIIGKLEIQIESCENEIDVFLKDLIPGVYYVSLLIDNEIVGTKKLLRK